MFYAALGRLVAALDQAAQTTLGIREVMAQAELDVAAIFKERDAGGAREKQVHMGSYNPSTEEVYNWMMVISK